VTVVIAVTAVLAAITGTSVVLTAAPKRQALSLSVFGLAITLLFVALQAPDVALSELGINALVVPLVILLVAEKVRERR
jgi:energy-converting hydrogenase B subunit D